MSKSLSRAEVQPLKEQLLQLRRRYDPTAIRDKIRDAAEAAQTGTDDADAATLCETSSVLHAVSQNQGNKLQQIELALDRIRNGTYGVCDECMGRIPKTRLQHMPETPLCVQCQRHLENQQGSVRSDIREMLRDSAD